MAGPLCRQTWTVSAVLLNMLCHGVMMSHISCLLPTLQDPESTIRADLHTSSLLASSYGTASIPGYLVSSVLMNIYGRRLAHMLMILPAIVGCLAIYFAQDICALMVGRILGGLSIGGTVFLGATVIGEYSDPKHRGLFLNLKTIAFGLGGLALHVLGRLLSWRTVAMCAVLPYICCVLITLTWPESPPWLASKGKFDQSKKSFFWLRGNTEASNRELTELIKAQMKRAPDSEMKRSFSTKVVSFLKKITEKDFLKSIYVVSIACVLMEAGGRHFFPAYALQIVGEVVGDDADLFYCTLGLDLLLSASTVGSSFLIRIVKRRALLFSTGFAACAVLLIACTYIALADGHIIRGQPWLAGSMFVVFFILVNLGCVPIPMVLMGELLPLAHRALGCAVVGVWISLILMVSLQVTPHLLASVKVQGTFFVYGITMSVALVILYYVLPETKGRTLQEIENYFKYGDYEDNQETKLNMLTEQDC